MLEMYLHATFEIRSLLALPVPELIGGGGAGEGKGVATSQKIGSVPGHAHALYPSPPKKKILCLPYRLFISVHSFSRDFRLEF